MPYDGNGVFQRIYAWVTDRNNGIRIRADRMDGEFDGIAAALTNCITRDGQSLPTQNLPMGGKRIIGLGAAVDPNDAVRKQYVDDNLGVPNIGDYLTTERDPGANWLKRDGAIKTQADYPALAALLGTKYASFSGFTPMTYGSSAQIQDLAYGNGKFVAFEAGGGIKVSTNSGGSWTAKTSGTSLAFTRGEYGNGNYVGVGASGLICTSPDAETWTVRASGTTEDLQSVVYADGRWVVVGNNGKILVSTDLENWAPRTVAGLPAGTGFYGIAYGNGRYVVVGGDGSQGIAAISLNGAASFTWSKTGANTTHQDVVYGAGIFVSSANATIFSSRSAVGAWTASQAAVIISGLGFASRNFFAVGASFTTSSLNGEDWKAHTAITGGFWGFAASPTHILIGGSGGALARAAYALDIVTQFQLPADNPDNGYIKAL